jgi:FtsP/CotA-like multicopper oxidase with cupredoxin domain
LKAQKSQKAFKKFKKFIYLNFYHFNDNLPFSVTSTIENYNNMAVINNISFAMPEFSLLSEPENIKEEMFCDENTKLNTTCLDNDNHNICRCTHRLKVKLNSIVDLVLIDIEDSQNHPFHLHGHKFYVMEMGSLNSTVAEVKKHGIPLAKNFNRSPIHKDTVVVPNKGYIRLRLKADNPGFWLAHCHFEWHLAIGMGFILQVGEIGEMKKPPKDYAKCYNYMPNNMN